MGVAASGKSTLAAALTDATGWPYLEGDDYHSDANVKKMSGGTPLTNEDRIGWIENMTKAVRRSEHETVILSCSALNEFVRTRLQEGCARSVHWIYLDTSHQELTRRMQTRDDHFMTEDMLDSQLAAMDPPSDCLRLNGNQTVDNTLAEVKKFLEKTLRPKRDDL